MDFLKTESGVIVIFASNMDMDHVDKGIIRARRVDQIIHVNHPTFEERIELFKMYLGNLYNDKLIDINKISKLSYGLTGSDVKKIINLIKINKVEEYIKNNPNNIIRSDDPTNGKTSYVLDMYSILNKETDNNEETNKNEETDNNMIIKIITDDIDKEISKCIMGLERDRKVNELNKKIIAYHEAGHAVLGF
jgi:ATP-dependent Zn protease